MQRYKLLIEYDGTPFVGWQFQKNGLSIQEVLQKAIFNLSKEKVVVTGAGRTDSGVHALGQVAHFDIHLLHSATPCHLATAKIGPEVGLCIFKSLLVIRKKKRNVNREKYTYSVCTAARGRTSGLGKEMFRTSTSPATEQIIAGVSLSLSQTTSSSPSIFTKKSSEMKTIPNKYWKIPKKSAAARPGWGS